MKTIALFGASGKTGQQFLVQALAKGYTIKALVRTPGKVIQRSPQLEIVKGDVLDPEAVARVVQGADLVVSLFGRVKDSPEWLQRDGTRNIVNAMKTYGVERIISLSGGGLPFRGKDQPRLPDKLIRLVMKLAVPQLLNDAMAHHKVLEESNLQWTIVRGPMLTTPVPTG